MTIWILLVSGSVVWRVVAAVLRARTRAGLPDGGAPNPYAPPSPYGPPPYGATAEGSRCPCGHRYRVLRDGVYGAFLGCSTWIDPNRGCQRACFVDGSPLPPALWRRNRRWWGWTA